jgi:single stranded DNA-binding protein
VDVNVWTGTGRVGGEPEFKTIGETELCEFSLAVNNYAGKGKEPETMWLRCQLWGDRVKVGEFIRKGMKLTISGKLETRKYGDDNERTDVRIRINDLALPPKGDNGGDDDEDEAPRRSSSARKSNTSSKSSSKGGKKPPF